MMMMIGAVWLLIGLNHGKLIELKMKRIYLYIITLIFSVPTFCQTYIKNVTVVDVEKKKLLNDQTVFFKSNKIISIKPSRQIIIPEGSNIIDGSGKFLIPGLTDSHIHFFQTGSLYTRPDAINLKKYLPYEEEIKWAHNNFEDILKRYLKSGITSVIDVGSTKEFLMQRNNFLSKDSIPKVYMTGPLITSYIPKAFEVLETDRPFNLVTTIEEGLKLVNSAIENKHDFIKIWYIVNPKDLENSAKKFQPIAKTIIDEAHKNGLKVAVHATQRITAQYAVESGCDFLVHSVEDEIVSNEFLELLKTKKVSVCPTLIVHNNYNKTFKQEMNPSSYELLNSNPYSIGSLVDLKHIPDTIVSFYKKRRLSKVAIEKGIKSDSIMSVNLKKMIDFEINIVAGTDAGNIGTQHASSFLEELKAMKNCGLTNWQILQSATINPARIFNNEHITGSISKGKNADMVLLTENPLLDIENISKIDLVIVNGNLINPKTMIKETPIALVQRQLNGYNFRNLEAFLEPYADDVEIYTFPDKLRYKGKDNMRKSYASFFEKNMDLHCEIKERIVQGNTIIDKEKVVGVGKTPFESTAIYQIENHKIKRVYFVR
jgi:imidazolonepropionase-like amidohydrolase